MEAITLDVFPNQYFTIIRDGHYYDITLRSLRSGILIVSLSRDSKKICDSVRVIRNKWIIPYRYLVGNGGNFRFELDDSVSEQYPHYSMFGVSASLVYYSNEEYVKMIGN